MHPINNPSWLVIFSLVELSMGSINNCTNSTGIIDNSNNAQLLNLSKISAPKRPLALGGQDFDQCCRLAIYQSLKIDNGTTVSGIKNNLYVDGKLEDFNDGQMPCGATYSATQANTNLTIRIPVRWCWKNCRGWQLSRTSTTDQWVSPILGFLIPSVVFCLAIPRRRKLHIPEGLFDVPLNEITSNIFRTPRIALIAAVLVTIDTLLWLMTIFALSGPILVSGIYEASLDQKILGFVQAKIDNKRLSITQRAQLLYTVLVGNLDMLTDPDYEDETNTAWSHIIDLLGKDREVMDTFTDKTKTRLRTMLAAQYSFGVTVGAPVVFFCGSFLYTLMDSYKNLGDNDTSHALAFGMWFMVIPHIAIISGLLLAGNNPNILEGIVEGPTCEPQPAYLHIFALVYDSRYRPTWIWRRGRNKKIWIKRVCEGPNQNAPGGFEGLKIGMNLGDWMVICNLAWFLILLPSLLALLTSFFTPRLGLSCRSMTFLAYMLCQYGLIVLWAWDIESTHLDLDGAPHTPVTRLRWGGAGAENRQAYVWWPLVVVAGFCSVVIAIGGTIMQVMGVYRNCLCEVPVQYWRRSQWDTKFTVSTNSSEDIERAKIWWKFTGGAAIAFLGFIAFVGWWYQRRLRYQFKRLVNRLDEKAEEEPSLEES